jgi:dTDP-4-dehydrorhamnose reductase
VKVLVLGASGMLGSLVTTALASSGEVDLSATVRSEELAAPGRNRLPDVDWRLFDASAPDGFAALSGAKWIVNCIGIIKPLIHDDNAFEVERAVRINSLLPHELARCAEVYGARVLQIATDCVYSGAEGRYVETDLHDALDVYGKTKSLGEVWSPNVFHLRCSIVGPEFGPRKSLLEWFRAQPRAGSVSGYTNHDWNGVTTFHYGKLCAGVILGGIELPHLQHVVPAGSVTKYELLESFAATFDRGDITIEPAEAPTAVDRRLATLDEALNLRLWQAAGYETPPTVPEMVSELAGVGAGIAPGA